MKRTIETIEGDTTGVSYSIPVYSFAGTNADEAPSAYLQAGLHADELPGPAALHFFLEMLKEAEAENRILGKITVVPHANPIGANQFHFGKMEGRFHLGTRDNFNRAHPHLATPDAALLNEDESAMSADKKLKWRLAKLSLGHDIILDLHCDDESLNYVYIAEELWPQTQDLASCLEADAVLLWSGDADQPFESAVLAPYLGPDYKNVLAEKLVVSTLELRGQRDVDLTTAHMDARRLFRFLVARGVIEADVGQKHPADYKGTVVPLINIDMLEAPVPGVILYHVEPGSEVEEGQPLVTLLQEPGNPEKDVTLNAPQAGLILTRRSHRYTRSGDALLKLLGTKPSKTGKGSILES
ncbi:succinylglutamate desuccinylase/aspartoacylase family protein [Pseudovibrio exalbescens]|uniref:succinylglutamate desuccinylase/aspartoacylase domain-containing protein n=1 Tax=Pseudovibrio exalbescens TaxID=197461 RepID=UPI002366D980|nr:succinylglutamate desuccinylase/aspartoacylase family protein [Pseudovibrio exalbescens]MDD7908988.1 succinylglutamate desuccinylase/aspartoacylase family protein [Pseudovibrio exalbescens]